MKLDTQTVQVLKNFSSINSNLVCKPGNQLRTISQTKSVMAKANVGVTFDKQFAIYDLSRFLGTLSMFKDPDLVHMGSYMEITEGSTKFNYTFSDPDLVIAAPDREINIPNPEIEFVLQDNDLQSVMRALQVSQLPEIAVTGKDGKIYIQACDTKGASKDTFSVEVGETKASFTMIFRAENIKLIPSNYNVKISSKGLAHFKSDVVEYWIAVESNSKYEG